MKDKEELPDLPSIAERLQWARNRKGLTQEELATMVNSDQTTIGKIENGKTGQPRNIVKLGEALEVPPAWLQFGIADLDKLTAETIARAIKINQLDPKALKAIDSLIDQLSS